ncbi:hypothetical protein [Marivita geojedonensis]|uniref:Uncharacterized protein n=1 Tax=Marivita geojedonensis TaxID=1123756 RepID=A0A1X4NQB8_9RHOB|nr:hypothetical protein [Marivita geojedonensis]OSQ53154.1 hypothetical protein MGEO_00900 [Marivita geojedonensis]
MTGQRKMTAEITVSVRAQVDVSGKVVWRTLPPVMRLDPACFLLVDLLLRFRAEVFENRTIRLPCFATLALSLPAANSRYGRQTTTFAKLAARPFTAIPVKIVVNRAKWV